MSYPATLDLTLLTAESERLDAQLAGIRFFPKRQFDWRLRSRSAARTIFFDVSVDWLTGKVVIVEAGG